LLERGVKEGLFRSGIDPLQLYVMMVAFSYFHRSVPEPADYRVDKYRNQRLLADRPGRHPEESGRAQPRVWQTQKPSRNPAEPDPRPTRA